MAQPTRSRQQIPRATALETSAVATDLLVPFVASGAIARRRRVVDLLDRLDADRRAVRRLQRLRDRYDEGPVLLRLPAREIAFVLAPNDVQRLLDESPEPFATANREKAAALSHFQPHGVLISHGAERAQRRTANERALDSHHEIHELASAFTRVVSEEAHELAQAARRANALVWDHFSASWWRLVRRIVFGDRARDDHELTDLLWKLRADANWAFLKPKRRDVRENFLARVRGYLEAPEADTLAQPLAAASESQAAPDHQVAHWLFAFDAGAISTFRALALLLAHPEHAHRARTEVGSRDPSAPSRPPLLRACVLEAIRLWPTTPVILRDTTENTTWRNGTLPPGSAVIVFAPFFHRDRERLRYADAFAPELWLEPERAEDWPLIPFSDGPGQCPGRNVVLLLASSLLAALLADVDLRQPPDGPLDSRAAMPATLSPYRLRFPAAG